MDMKTDEIDEIELMKTTLAQEEIIYKYFKRIVMSFDIEITLEREAKLYDEFRAQFLKDIKLLK